LPRENIERIFIKTGAHVIGSDLKNPLGVPSQVRQLGSVVPAQPQGFITKQRTGRILLPPESETLAGSVHEAQPVEPPIEFGESATV